MCLTHKYMIPHSTDRVVDAYCSSRSDPSNQSRRWRLYESKVIWKQRPIWWIVVTRKNTRLAKRLSYIGWNAERKNWACWHHMEYFYFIWSCRGTKQWADQISWYARQCSNPTKCLWYPPAIRLVSFGDTLPNANIWYMLHKVRVESHQVI